MLFYFKYANFVLSSINAIFGTGFAPIQGISVLPLGISFYTFQTLSYTIDVYRRDVKTEHNIIDFGAYVVMFPSSSPAPSSSTGTSPTASTSTKAAMSSSRLKTA